MCDATDLGPIANGWQVMIEARRVQHRFEVAMDQSLEVTGISYAQYRALEVLLDSNEMHVSELARKLRLTRQSALDTVNKLQRSGFVELQREAHATYIVVTDAASRPVTRCREFAQRTVTAIDEHLSPFECGRLVLLLHKADRAVRPPTRPTWWLES